jgi:hypothetical protein
MGVCSPADSRAPVAREHGQEGGAIGHGWLRHAQRGQGRRRQSIRKPELRHEVQLAQAPQRVGQVGAPERLHLALKSGIEGRHEGTRGLDASRRKGPDEVRERLGAEALEPRLELRQELRPEDGWVHGDVRVQLGQTDTYGHEPVSVKLAQAVVRQRVQRGEHAGKRARVCLRELHLGASSGTATAAEHVHCRPLRSARQVGEERHEAQRIYELATGMDERGILVKRAGGLDASSEPLLCVERRQRCELALKRLRGRHGCVGGAGAAANLLLLAVRSAAPQA